uniref:Spliceosome-associated protein CWC15 homolog n=1 Tax=Sarcophilus harrisii TaxID=9305 RepID=A0A7N4V1T7_SARHA
RLPLSASPPSCFSFPVKESRVVPKLYALRVLARRVVGRRRSNGAGVTSEGCGTRLKQTTQDAPEEVRNRDFRRELEERERVAAREKNRDRPTREHTTSSSVSKKPRLDQIPAANLDADDPLTDEDDEDEDFEEESDDDDTAALLAELEKIKKERAEEQARKEQEQKAEEERIRMENILSGNPLLNLTGPSQPQANFKVKRRWDDDVVFKNCAKGVDELKKDKRFVNDTLRSEFHKKFMEKYIK